MITSIFLRYGNSLEVLPILLLTASLFIMSIIDIKKQEISNTFIIVNLCITFLHIMITGELNLLDRLCGMLIISVPLAILFQFNENIFGGGDIKLLFSVGGILGINLSILAFVLGVVFGGIVATALLLSKTYKRSDHIAFGNHLSIGIFTALILGDSILNFYSQLFI